MGSEESVPTFSGIIGEIQGISKNSGTEGFNLSSSIFFNSSSIFLNFGMKERTFPLAASLELHEPVHPSYFIIGYEKMINQTKLSINNSPTISLSHSLSPSTELEIAGSYADSSPSFTLSTQHIGKITGSLSLSVKNEDHSWKSSFILSSVTSIMKGFFLGALLTHSPESDSIPSLQTAVLTRFGTASIGSILTAHDNSFSISSGFNMPFFVTPKHALAGGISVFYANSSEENQINISCGTKLMTHGGTITTGFNLGDFSLSSIFSKEIQPGFKVDLSGTYSFADGGLNVGLKVDLMQFWISPDQIKNN